MATSDNLANAVAALTRGLSASGAKSQLWTVLEQLQGANQAQADAMTKNTVAVLANTTAKAATSSGGGWGETAWTLIGSALPMVPLIRGLVDLFGGGGKSEPPPLMEYVAPAPLRFEGEVDRGAGVTQWSEEAAGRARQEPVTMPAMPQVTVQVTAMDSRSFLDHSDEIARAVRQAMLNSHSLNDVVSEL